MDLLRPNPYLKIIEAEKFYNSQNVHKAYEIVKKISETDFYFVNAVPLYTAILIELNKVGELYYLAHKLVSANPNLGVSWFAVGSYYFLVKKYDLARKYFEKANKLDKNFVACWIVFGHSFAALDESEQALSAYRTAARLFPGCHIATMCIGMEYLRTNNLQTALGFFEQAQDIYENDYLVQNEQGVVYYKKGEYDQALEFFLRALKCCQDGDCQTVLLNLGHCYRKKKDLDKAIEYYQQCLSLNDKDPLTYSAMGFAYHLKGEYREALNFYNKSSFLKSDDPFVNDLISKALNDINRLGFDE